MLKKNSRAIQRWILKWYCPYMYRTRINRVFISKYLNENDHIVSNHRGHGHYLSRFKDIEGLIAEVMGKRSGCSGGYGVASTCLTVTFYQMEFKAVWSPLLQV